MTLVLKSKFFLRFAFSSSLIIMVAFVGIPSAMALIGTTNNKTTIMPASSTNTGTTATIDNKNTVAGVVANQSTALPAVSPQPSPKVTTTAVAQSNLTALATTPDQLEQEKQSILNEIQALEADLATDGQELQNAYAQLVKYQNTENQLSAEVVSIKSQADQKNQEITTLVNDQMKPMWTRIQSLNTQISTKTSDLGYAQSALDVAKANILKCEAEIKRLTGLIGNYAPKMGVVGYDQYGRPAYALIGVDPVKEGYIQARGIQQGALVRNQTDVASLTLKIAGINADLVQLKADRDQLKLAYAALNTQYKALYAEWTTLNDSYTATMKSLGLTRLQIVAQYNSIDLLNEDISELKARIGDLYDRLNKLSPSPSPSPSAVAGQPII